MFHPLSIFVGLRYVRARSHKFFVSFITWASLLGVCLGVAALIVILSVMNGLEGELRDRLLSLSAHARVIAGPDLEPSSDQWQSLAQRLRSAPGVQGVAPYAEIQALAVRTPEMVPIVLRGIDPKVEGTVSDAARAVKEGHLADLQPGTERVIVGEVIAERLGLARGDHLTVLVPTVGPDGAPAPKLRELEIAGVFEVGLPDHDAVLVYANMEDIRALAPAEESSMGLRVRFDDALAAPALAAKLSKRLPKGFEIIDWTQDNASYFRAIRIEKTMMSIILMLVVAVAAFSIVSMLVMVVTDKRTDIAILRTFGASPRKVMGVFITQGLVIGWLGVAFGIALGLAIALHVGPITAFLQKTFGFSIFDPDVYYISDIPSEVRWSNVVTIGVIALALTALSTIYPALRASRTAPAEALRYE